jgi:hypothetical protein
VRYIAIDTETDLFKPGEQVPKLVCVSVQRQGREPELYDHSQGAKVFEALVDECVASPDDDPLILTTQNGPYDFAVMVRAIGTMSLKVQAADMMIRTVCAEWLDRRRVLNLEPCHPLPTAA